jgi:hypothetical protein
LCGNDNCGANSITIYLFVPDNPKYEGSVELLFDEDNHPIRLE